LSAQSELGQHCGFLVVAGCGSNLPMKTYFILVVSLSTVLASCSKDSDSKGSDSEAKTEASTKVAAEATSTEDSDDPCDLLSAALVRKHLELADDVEINQKLSSPGGFPHCSYRWSTLTPEEEKERNAEVAKRTMARMQAKGKAQGIVDMAMSQNSGIGSAHLTMTEEMDSQKAAIGALGTARKYMEKRAKAKLGNESVDFTSTFVDVEGVGAKAHYSKKQRQLSYVHGKRLFHLGVRSHVEADAQELAKAVANDILK
jgi:hypothetical protein